MKYLYGWGASVVLIGALFKLTHWPGANAMLTVGLVTEAIIFFFSAFEPLHEELDWTLVYPQLAGLDAEIDTPVEKTGLTSGSDALTKFNEMIEKAGDTNLFEKFGSGIEKLNAQVEQMAQLSDAAVVTNEFTDNLKNASNAVSEVSYSASNLSDAFQGVSQTVSKGGEEFAEAYKQLTSNMDLDFSSLKEGNSEYNQHISNLNKNLSALNAIFELQLNETDLEQMMTDLQGSVEHSKKYNEEITKLGKKLEALNTVYGNMLSAMNVNID
ncbi:MAG: gliding motility protein GldL [Chlorobi bacterium]|nr:gliding motility protein GldL [Chlorobiota bacterium]